MAAHNVEVNDKKSCGYAPVDEFCKEMLKGGESELLTDPYPIKPGMATPNRDEIFANELEEWVERDRLRRDAAAAKKLEDDQLAAERAEVVREALEADKDYYRKKTGTIQLYYL